MYSPLPPRRRRSPLVPVIRPSGKERPPRREAPRGDRPARLPAGELLPDLSRSGGSRARCAAAGSLAPRSWDGGGAPRAPRSGGPHGGSWCSGSGLWPRGCGGARGATPLQLAGGPRSSGRMRGTGGVSPSPSLARRAECFGVGMRSEESIKLSGLVDFFFPFIFFFPPRSPASCHFTSSLIYFAFHMAASCVGRSLRREPRLAARSGGTGSRPGSRHTAASSPATPMVQTPRECPRSTSRGSSRPRTREGMGGEGSELGNCEGQVRRADYLCSFPMFMGCPVRHRTRSCCVGAPQDYLWGHVRRAAPGGWLLSAFYISL